MYKVHFISTFKSYKNIYQQYCVWPRSNEKFTLDATCVTKPSTILLDTFVFYLIKFTLCVLQLRFHSINFVFFFHYRKSYLYTVRVPVQDRKMYSVVLALWQWKRLSWRFRRGARHLQSVSHFIAHTYTSKLAKYQTLLVLLVPTLATSSFSTNMKMEFNKKVLPV